MRNYAMALIFLFSIGVSFAAKSRRFSTQASYLIPRQPTACLIGNTDDGCNTMNTGVVCTVYVLGTNVTAYHPGAPNVGIPCTVPLRKL